MYPMAIAATPPKLEVKKQMKWEEHLGLIRKTTDAIQNAYNAIPAQIPA